MTINENKIDEILLNSKKKLTIIFIAQTLMLLITILLLFLLNIGIIKLVPKPFFPIVNSAFFGFIGSLIYFSRKSYVYLITNKFKKIIDENKDGGNQTINSIKNIARGYYLYLFFRPFVGIVIGPILYMLALTGLITLIKSSVNENETISQSGRYLIYILSFVGGHSSSDILDKFSKFASQIGRTKGGGVEITRF